MTNGRSKASVLLIAFLLPHIAACATIIRGTSNQIMINSEPPGARVRTQGGGMIGTTPVVLEIPSRKDVAITIEKEGYKPATVNLESRWQWGMMFWGILVYVVPFAVDLATGAIWQHNDKLVAVHLEPSSTATD